MNVTISKYVNNRPVETTVRVNNDIVVEKYDYNSLDGMYLVRMYINGQKCAKIRYHNDGSLSYSRRYNLPTVVQLFGEPNRRYMLCGAKQTISTSNDGGTFIRTYFKTNRRGDKDVVLCSTRIEHTNGRQTDRKTNYHANFEDIAPYLPIEHVIDQTLELCLHNCLLLATLVKHNSLVTTKQFNNEFGHRFSEVMLDYLSWYSRTLAPIQREK